ncbi:MAG: sugar ABC transporter permease [Bacilli bacterium]|jgi:multiple sugar transport system permease protein|nr:sugar ABC transporter permease [Bacilli bacterium]MCH4236205.1 sugar ABC transporter permease [Bacilli bacterium]
MRKIVKSPDAEASSGGTSLKLSERPTLETRKPKRNISISAKAWIALIPALFFLTIFTVYPIINTTIIAFINNFNWQDGAGSFALSNYFVQLANSQNPDLLTPVTAPSFGFQNFYYVLTSSEFLRSLLNTAILTLVSVPLTILISLLIAVFLNSLKWMRGVYQTIFFLPYVTNTIALGMVFNVMLGPYESGLVNQFMSLFGVSARSWISTGISGVIAPTRFTMGVAIITYTVWTGIAFKILVFMSGLASIDRQYYDAARIDGSSRFTIFRRITVPLLSPQLLYITITSFIGSFKAYTGVMSLFGNGSANNGAGDFGGASTTEWLTVVGYIYANRQLRLPVAAAGSVVLLIIILFITVIQMQVSKTRVHY